MLKYVHMSDSKTMGDATEKNIGSPDRGFGVMSKEVWGLYKLLGVHDLCSCSLLAPPMNKTSSPTQYTVSATGQPTRPKMV